MLKFNYQLTCYFDREFSSFKQMGEQVVEILQIVGSYDRRVLAANVFSGENYSTKLTLQNQPPRVLEEILAELMLSEFKPYIKRDTGAKEKDLSINVKTKKSCSLSFSIHDGDSERINIRVYFSAPNFISFEFLENEKFDSFNKLELFIRDILQNCNTLRFSRIKLCQSGGEVSQEREMFRDLKVFPTLGLMYYENTNTPYFKIPHSLDGFDTVEIAEGQLHVLSCLKEKLNEEQILQKADEQLLKVSQELLERYPDYLMTLPPSRKLSRAFREQYPDYEIPNFIIEK